MENARSDGLLQGFIDPLCLDGRIMVTTKELMSLLSLSRRPAKRIGEKAGAKRTIGRVVRWNLQRIREYVYSTEVLEDDLEEEE